LEIKPRTFFTLAQSYTTQRPPLQGSVGRGRRGAIFLGHPQLRAPLSSEPSVSPESPSFQGTFTELAQQCRGTHQPVSWSQVHMELTSWDPWGWRLTQGALPPASYNLRGTGETPGSLQDIKVIKDKGSLRTWPRSG